MQIAKVLSTRTPAQIKKHAECFFKQNLKTQILQQSNGIESPSLPMGKLKSWSKKSAEQQKHRQSFSPEDTVQMLCKNADAHRKQRKSLPPEKKVKILETDADAHKEKQESLSSEDKDLFVKNNTAA